MDWKLSPSTHASVYNQEFSQQSRVSTEQLFHNLDALLRRDIRDCLSKQLQGLLNNNVRIYRVRESFQRRQKIGNLDAEDNFKREVKCNSVKEKHCKLLSLKCPNTEVHKSSVDSQLSRSRCGKSKSAAYTKGSFSSKEPATPPPISPMFSSSNCNNKRQLQLTSETNNGGDVLPSNGWWREKGSSDSDTEGDAGETDYSASFNLNMKNDEFEQAIISCSSPESVPLPLFVSDVSENYHSWAKMQARTSSCPAQLSKAQRMQSNERNGKRELCNFFQLTSGVGNEEESCPPQTSPVPDDKTCKTCSEDKPLSCFRGPLIVARNADISHENLKLNYGELLQHRPDTTSRIYYNTLETSGYNSASAPSKGRIISSRDHSQRRLIENRSKILCALPEVNNKTRPAGYPEKTVKRRPNTANIPVKLKFKHKSKSGVSGKLTEDRDTDERVLPTTLSKSADASYSIMTPYMANIVWSVMDDEKVL